ncbi:dynein intermediate chain 3, ciliary-like [Manduca sexta]|uniref:Dynein intermediate chain 3, ciliary n=1 Tax=Manduca sexta TaxID=7130 RepID=A0A922CGG5_MANSE|nr:dynein intermediate chain 3, ciliary-like [Manduca sexta]KAG6445312.1 hypothetical protein O3G_MSEX003868 [Manduca sexta]
MPYMKSTYEYTKLRKNFGRQILFQALPAQMLDSINPNIEDQQQYILRNPVHRDVQATMPQSENETNTKQVVIHEQGINHTEGGWPREVHTYNEDHVLRHCRRVMHDDNYIHTVLSLAPIMEHYVDQNNAIEMYQNYFDDMTPQKPVEKYSVRVTNIFRDVLHRSINCIQWTNEKKPKLVVAYADKYSPESDILKSNDCYIWDINRQMSPLQELNLDQACWQLACSPVDPEVVIAGLENGTVNIFDIRESANAVSSSSVYNSHRSPVTALLYTHSRTHTEFFTGSLDGQCIWWDCRNLSQPLDRLTMSVRIASGEEPCFTNAEGVTSLDYDQGLPTKFLCGTESGLVINVNRMGRTHSEVLSSYWDAHCGPVRAVHRSHCTLRMFLTCGDWAVRIWSEEVRTAPIIVTKPYRQQVTDATWAPLRYSSYMVACADGIFYYWDFLRKYKDPLVTLKVSNSELKRITPHRKGELVAIGDNDGSLFLLSLSEYMIAPGKDDKQLMMKTYERETRREHFLDTRLKEIRLKARAEEITAEDTSLGEEVDEETETKKTEEEYFKIVNEELRQMESTTPSNLTII